MRERMEALKEAAAYVSSRREAYVTAAKLSNRHGFESAAAVLTNMALELADIQTELLERVHGASEEANR